MNHSYSHTRIPRALPAVVCLLLCCGARLFAQDVVLDRVNFNSLSRDWVKTEIQITCQGIRLRRRETRIFWKILKFVLIALSKRIVCGRFRILKSEIEILIMEKSMAQQCLLLPARFVDGRDKLKFPKYYYIEIEVNGEPLPPENEAYEGIGPTSIDNFKAKVEAGSESTKHALMPVYLAPLGISKLPANCLFLFAVILHRSNAKIIAS